MKFFKILFLVLFIFVVITFVSAVIFLKTFDINKYRPQIVKQVKIALGRDVSLGSITLDLSAARGVTLTLRDLRIADNPEFSRDNFVNIQSVNLGVDLAALVARRQILVSDVTVKSPKIVIIRDKSGRINAQTLAVVSANGKNSPAPGSAGDSAPNRSSAPSPSRQEETKAMINNLLVKSIKLDGGTLVYKDRMLDPQLSVEVSQIKLTVDNFSLADAFDFSLQGALWSQTKNVNITGSAKIDLGTNNIELSDVKISSDLSDLSLDLLEQSLPALKAAGLKDNLRGSLEATADKMIAGPSGLANLSLSGKLKDGKVEFKELPLPFDNIKSSFTATANDIKFKESTMNFGSGLIALNGQVSDYLKEPLFDFKMKAEGIDLMQVIDQKDQSVQLEGKLYAQFDMKGKGLNGSGVLKSLKGDGSMSVKDGKLVNINVLKLVLSKISMIPGVVEKVETNLPEKYKTIMDEKDTVLEKVDFKARISDGVMVVDDAQIQANAFLLSGQGTIGFDNRISLNEDITVEQELSKSMAASAEGLQYLLDEQGQISIPLTVSGKIPNVAFLPDVEYLAKRIIANRGAQELEKVLNKVFKKEGDSTPQPAPQNPQGTPPGQGQTPAGDQTDQRKPEEKIIDDILNRIFK